MKRYQIPILPFVLGALFLIWASASGTEIKAVVALALLIPLISTVVLYLAWERIGWHCCQSPRARWSNFLLGITCLVVFVSVPRTHWPLRLAYHISQPAFETAAQNLRAGKKLPQPTWIGIVWVEKAEIYPMNDKICFWTDYRGSNNTGFTKCPPHDVPFNLWSNLTLDEHWQFVSED